eukprot:TRINITY_DN5307_c0_g1_i2.p1 TRINITY_DN5307_c0_g1~~TRINITY_DN5307_c0_g1_i2.p1  ORF type:complete len:377 (-),score=84.30 TRINITY_DN5307_c0_g1_i2:225-1355(-)
MFRFLSCVSSLSTVKRVCVVSHVRRFSLFGRVADAEFVPMDESTLKLADGIRSGDRASLARGITLVESLLSRHQRQADHLVSKLAAELKAKDDPNRTIRVGISGPPGAGKSTFIEALGTYLTSIGNKVAVLAIDPSSSISGGSILGDKTRMTDLSRDENAYVRPTPNGGTLGGVARFTNDSILLCEVSGYNIVLVETVGVGQSEIRVADMVDLFLLLVPPAAGDELQGIKKGIMEVADLIVVSKADGPTEDLARHSQVDIMKALKFIRPRHQHWKTRVLRYSAQRRETVVEVWKNISEFKQEMTVHGDIQRIRGDQRQLWMWTQIQEELMNRVQDDSNVKSILPRLMKGLKTGEITPRTACNSILRSFLKIEDEKK